MLDLGVVRPGSTIRIPFPTFDKDDGSSITMTNFAVADILIYKDGSTTERASTTGYTATTDFDSKAGRHIAVIDLSSNATAGFFTAGSEYLVMLDSVTVDAVTVGTWLARFKIGYDGAILDTTIASLSSQSSFTLTTGPAENDALNGMWAIIHDIASAVQWSWVQISDYVGSTKTVTLAAGATFTVAAGDNISIMFPSPLQPVVTGNKFGVESNGNVSDSRIGNLDATVSSRLASASYTTPPTVAAIADAVLDEDMTAHQTQGSLGQAIGDPGAVASSLWSTVNTNLDAQVSTRLATSGYTTPPTVAAIADGVWDEALSGHLGAGSTGAALNAAGSAGDPWNTSLPGAYGAGTAGNILGNNLDAAVSSRLATAGYTTPPTAAAIADAVLDEDMTAHQTTGTLGKTIGDPVSSTVTIWDRINSNLDATISSRLATASYTAPPSAASVADAVWDEDATAHQTQGTFGQAIGDPGAVATSLWSTVNTNLDAQVSTRLATAGYTAPPSAATIADAVLDEDMTGHQTQGSLGQAIGDPVANAATIWGTVNTNLDATVSSRLPTASYTAPPTAAAIADQVWDEDATDHQTQGSFGQAIGDPGAVAVSMWSRINTNLDTTVSSRLATAGYTTPPTVAAIADGVWDEDATDHQTQGTFGQAIGDPGATAASLWSTVNTNLDAAITSRSSHSAADVWGVGTRTLTAFTFSVDISAGAVDAIWDEAQSGHTTADTFGKFLDVEVSSRLATASYTAPPSAGSVADAVWDESTAGHVGAGTFGEQLKTDVDAILADTDSLDTTKITTARANNLDNLNAAITTRSSHSAADVWASGTRTLTASLDPTAAAIADAVWDELTSGHLIVGSFGQFLQPNHAGTAQGGSANTIILAADASASDDYYNDAIIQITKGPGAGQSQTVADYVGATRTATMATNWVESPDNTSKYVAHPHGQVAGATAPTAAEVADAVWNESRTGHTDAGTFGLFLDAQISTLNPGAGGGAFTVTMTVTDGATPIQGARVRLSSGAETYYNETDSNGVAVFNVDAGVWNVAITHSAYQFGGTTITVDGNETPTFVVTAVTFIGSSPGFTTGFLYAYDHEGNPEEDVQIHAVPVGYPDADVLSPTGVSLDNTVRTETSDVNGLVQFPNLFKGIRYEFWRGTDTKKYYVTIPLTAGATYELSLVVGKP